MKRTAKVVALLLALCMTVAAFAGCASTPAASTETAAPSTDSAATTAPEADSTETAAPEESSDSFKSITVAKTGPLVGLDQHAYSDGVSLEVIATLFDGLVTLDADGNLVPTMAESWDVSEDGLTYTFHLRDAQWSNGTPVTAHDFVYSWRRNADPATASQYNYELVTAGVKNAEAIINGEMDPTELGVSALDDKTLVVELDHVVPFFTAMLIRCSFMPLNQEFVEAQGDNYGKTPESIISCGPYVLTYWDYANNVTVTKNETYWNAENIDIDEINFRTVTDQQTAAMLFQSGEVDFAEISGELVDLYENDPAFSKVQEVHVAYIMPNIANNEYLQNANLRRALALAYNKEAIADQVMKNGAVAANFLVGYKLCVGPDGKEFRDTSPTYLNYNAEEAATYWEAAKAELGIDSLELELTHYDDTVSIAVSEYIAAQIEENLPGVTILLDTQPKQNAIERGQNGDFDLFLFRWGPDYKDPLAFLELLKSDASYNWGGYNNPEYDEMITETKTGSLAADAEGRWQVLKDAEALLLDTDVGVFPVYQNGLAVLINPAIHNLDVRNVGVTYNYRIVTMDD